MCVCLKMLRKRFPTFSLLNHWFWVTNFWHCMLHCHGIFELIWTWWKVFSKILIDFSFCIVGAGVGLDVCMDVDADFLFDVFLDKMLFWCFIKCFYLSNPPKMISTQYSHAISVVFCKQVWKLLKRWKRKVNVLLICLWIGESTRCNSLKEVITETF